MSLTKAQRQLAPLWHPIHFLSLGFGSGLMPKAPGTFGSLAAIPLIILMAKLDITAYVMITLAASIIGVWLCDFTAYKLKVHDHGAIVWDEIAGMMVAFIAIPLTWDTLLIGFVMFRFFDIAKPWIIGVMDKRLKGGVGIMADDLVAGGFACIGLHGYVLVMSLL